MWLIRRHLYLFNDDGAFWSVRSVFVGVLESLVGRKIYDKNFGHGFDTTE
jgi:hypothetical protein